MILNFGSAEKNGIDLFEKLRKKIETNDFVFEDMHIKVTITSGMSDYAEGLSVDEWINDADEKLYQGKNSGKNKVVFKKAV